MKTRAVYGDKDKDWEREKILIKLEHDRSLAPLSVSHGDDKIIIGTFSTCQLCFW